MTRQTADRRRPARPRRWPRIALLLIAVAGALALVLLGAVLVLGRDRDELMDRFASERAHQLEAALAEIESDLGAVTDDLRLAVELSASSTASSAESRELGALVTVVREYRSVEVRNADNQLVAHAAAVGAAPELSTAVAASVTATCQAALAAPGSVRVSPPFTEGGRWLRVFAWAAVSTPRLVAAFVVDTEPYFSRLRIITADPGANVIILGSHGVPAPATDAPLRDAIEDLRQRPDRRPAFARLVQELRKRSSGILHIPRGETVGLGLPDADAVAIYRPIHIEGGHDWSTALLASTASLNEREQAIARRMLAVVGIIALVFATVSGFVIVSTRRNVALRERLRRAAEVAHLHEKATKVLDTIPTGVAVLGEDRRVTALNAVLRERVGDPELGRELSVVFASADDQARGQLEALVENVMATDAPRSLYGEALRIFGGEGSYNIHALPLEKRLPDACVLLVIEDLSMIGSLERQLIRSEKLATVGVLAAGIAHEIGTPLGIVRGRAEYMLGKLAEDDRAAEGYRIIIEQIDHVSRTIRQLLDFARVRPGVVGTAVDVGAAARSVVELLRVEAERRGLHLELELPGSLPLVAASPDELEQVLVNLVMNACDASDRGQPVRISATEAHGSRAVQITVSDRGRGISSEDRERVFDPFFTTKKRGQGTGLGLTIVTQIVRSYGATIQLESEPGAGTQVVLLWPVAHKRQQEAVGDAG